MRKYIQLLFIFCLIILFADVSAQSIKWAKSGAGDKFTSPTDRIFSIQSNDEHVYAIARSTGDKIKIEDNIFNSNNTVNIFLMNNPAAS